MDEKEGVVRKNAPETEIGKQKLTAEAKRKNRPEWMTQGNHYLHSYKGHPKLNEPITRSLFDIGTYQHNFNTALQLAEGRVDYLR